MHLARRHYIVVNAVSKVRCVCGRYLQPGKFVTRDECCARPCGQRAKHTCVVADSSPDACDDGSGCLMIVVHVLPHVLATGPFGDVELAHASCLRQCVQVVAELMSGDMNRAALRLLKTPTVKNGLDPRGLPHTNPAPDLPPP